MVTRGTRTSLAWGVAGSLFILAAFYMIQVLGMQDWEAPVDFMLDKWYFVAPLVVGFGTQAGLFHAIHRLARHGGGPPSPSTVAEAMVDKRLRRASGAMAASGGVSGTTMLACCMHNLVLLFPILGASGMATFFAAYQSQVFLASIGVSFLGVAYMIWKYYSIKRACKTHHN